MPAPWSAAVVKLNVGSFVSMFPDWRNSDIIPGLEQYAQQHGFTYSRWSMADPIPYDDGIVDLIFSCHALEHVPRDVAAHFLRECHRVLKPGGIVRLLVPDAEVLCKAYLDGNLGQFDEWLTPEMKVAPDPAKLWEIMCANHRALYDWRTLYADLTAAGFGKVCRAEFGKSRSPVMQAEAKDLYPGLSLIVEAVR
jgi:predicted SAM-dependent methyltransferase